jgi:hypothetical protein
MQARRLIFFVLFLFTAVARAQVTGDIRGFIYEKESSEPAIYTSVFLKGTPYGTQTSLEGYFSLTKIPPGNYTLMVTSIGFDTLSIPVTVKGHDIQTKKLYLEKSVIEFREVNVSAEREVARTETGVSVNKITPKEISELPSVGGEPDLAQYLQVIPGVVSSGDQGGQLYIRGGTPVQNRVLLDGMTIYNPFHSIGLYSVFDNDIIRGAEVYTGGFGAEYGGRISSIIDVTTRDGNKNRFGGKVSAGTFTAKVNLEGPLKKQTEETGGSSSFLFSGRTSYLDQSSKLFYSYVDKDGMPYSFTDLYGKLSFNGAKGSKISFFGFRFADRADYQHVAEYKWNSAGGGTKFVLVPAGSSVLTEGHVAYSNYDITLTEGDGLPRQSSIGGYNFGLDFSYFILKNVFKYGIEINGLSTDLLYYNTAGLSYNEAKTSTDLYGYLDYKWVTKQLVVEAGVRINYYSGFDELSPEPRLSVKYNATDKVRLKAASGIYTQNLLSATSDRDVVNLFYGFLTGSSNVPSTFRGEPVTSYIQKAYHLIGGVEVDLPLKMTFNAEAYIKDFTQLQNLNRDKIYEDVSKNAKIPDHLKKDYIIEDGYAKGVDLTLKYGSKRTTFYAVYSLAYVSRYDDIREYTPHFDRRHNINLVATYRPGKKNEWEISGRWNFGSPFPFTLTQGFYPQLLFDNGVGTDIQHQNGELGIQYADLNTGRLSTYHRLDLSVARTFTLSAHSVLEATVSLTNAYDRDNVFYRDRVTHETVYQLPILPSAGLSLTF